ncbi:MAG: UvrD-helicase domain-containing protein [Pirellulales bacterium]
MTTSVALTSEQAKALETRDTSIALAAGAGCGKTFVLSERFLSHLDRDNRLLKEVAGLNQLVAITFTDAAAREMRRRIRLKCYERAQTAPTEESQDAWLKLLRAIEAARVSTIHAFCASLLREHAVVAGLDPAFGVLEQAAADVLESEVIDDVLRRQLADLIPETLGLAAALGLSQLKEQLRELLAKRHTRAFSDWHGKSAEELVAAWKETHDRVAVPNALAELAGVPEIDVITELLHSVTPTKPAFVEAKATLLEFLPRMVQGNLAEAEFALLRECAGVQKICTAKDWPNAESFASYRDACKGLRAAIDKYAPKPFDADRAHDEAELGLQLLDLVHDVAEEYRRRKAREGKLDFDDLLSQAHSLVTSKANDSLRKRISDDLRLVLVDEFQDTDQLQVELVQALCGDIAAGKLFFVGDMNQSIYRFRGAQPDVFRDLRQQVPEPGRLPLSKNFRSQPAVLHFVNTLFAHTFGEEYQPLTANRTQVTSEPAIEFLWTITPDKKSKIGGATKDAREQEARRIARRLRQLIDSQEPIIADAKAKVGKRGVQPGDVAILFRALSDVALYENALREYDLDYYLVGGHAYYSQQEIYDVLNLLRAVASEADEISLAGVLRSPFFALEDETLFWLVESGGSLNDGLFGESLPKELSNDERIKVQSAAATLRSLRSVKDSLPIATLLEQALAHTGYDAALLGEFLGERKLANLNKLLEQARTADAGNVLDLDGFIAQLAEFVVREPKEALAATLSEEANVIRLMTIHHAKGLEFPLVVVPDIDRKADGRTASAALDERLGPVVKLPAEDDDPQTATGITLYRAQERRAEADERKRLFYVAATRAADYLILSSSLVGYDAESLESDWTRLLAVQFDLSTGEFRGMLPTADELPRVRVIDSDPAIDFQPKGRGRGADLVELVQTARDLAAGGGGVVPQDVGPLAADVAARRQFSVSRLSGKLVRPDSREEEFTAVAAPEEFDPLTFGTFVHTALARLDFGGKPSVRALCEQIAEERVLTNAAAIVDQAAQLVEQFCTSKRWVQIKSAKTVHRELEFLLAWPPEGPSGYGRHIRGYFDCVYQDAAGGWHLVDYKTNTRANADWYEMQMLLYALAFERAVGTPPVELALHFLRQGVEHRFEWNDATRTRAIVLVNDAMQDLIAQVTRPSS